MRNLKKLASVVLAAVMTLALAVPAFAAQDPEYKITIENPVVGETYNFYKMFDVTATSNGSGLNYDYIVTEDWVDFFGDSGAGKEFLSTEETDYIVTIGSENKYLDLGTGAKDDGTVIEFANAATAYAQQLETPTATKTVEEADLVEGQYTENLTAKGAGYYLVFAVGATQTNASSNGSVCALTTTDPTSSIKIKAEKPSIDKTSENQTATVKGVGETVPFTITGKVPNTTGYETFTYKISDTMSTGLTFDKTSVNVTVNGDDLDESNYVLDTTKENGFDLTIKVMDLQDQVGKEIKVTYNATVNEKAVNVNTPEANSATLTYSNDPTSDTDSTTENPPEIVKVYNAKIDVLKHNSSNTRLANAKFILKDKDANKYYRNTNGEVTWVENVADATELATNADGGFDTPFVGLGAKTYTLIETAAPEGYNKLADGITVTITPYVDPNEGDTENPTPENQKVPVTTAPDGKILYINALSHTEDVLNLTGAELPETGGMGTTLFYAVGGLLVVSAGVLLVVKKRMGAE